MIIEGCRVHRTKAASRALHGRSTLSSKLKIPRVGVVVRLNIRNFWSSELISCLFIWNFPDLWWSIFSGGSCSWSYQMIWMTANPSHFAWWFREIVVYSDSTHSFELCIVKYLLGGLYVEQLCAIELQKVLQFVLVCASLMMKIVGCCHCCCCPNGMFRLNVEGWSKATIIGQKCCTRTLEFAWYFVCWWRWISEGASPYLNACIVLFLNNSTAIDVDAF